MNKSYKYRIYPNAEQKQLLAQTFGCVRVVYNNLLDWRTKEYTVNKVKINYTMTSAKLTQLKTMPEYEWLNNVSAVALQQALRNQDKAFSNFFAKRSKYPNFKKKNNSQSFRLVASAFRVKDNELFLAKSDDAFYFRNKGYKTLPTNATSVTISKDCANRYFASFCCDVEIKPMPKVDKTVGIDLGLTDFLITSDGEKIKPLKLLTEYQTKLATLQRQLSKKVKGSKNRDKARIRVAKLHNKINDSRKDFLHKLSYKLINENQVICLEDLNVIGMMKNHKLAKAIADASWSEFNRQLEYKALWYGRTISRINAWYPSSQICSDCGHLDGKKPLHIRTWTCAECGVVHDRDVNASKNIHTVGLTEI